MIQKLIENLLGKIPNKYISENFNKYEINYNFKNLKTILNLLNIDNYKKLNDNLQKLGYRWNLTIDEYSYSVSQSKFETLEIDELIDETENINVSFDIYKTKRVIIVINDKVFNNYIEGISLETLINNIRSFEEKFTIINDDFNIEIDKKYEDNFSISKQCNFKNSELLLFKPNVFYFNNIDRNTKSKLDDTILKLSLVYSLIFLFDSSQIKDDDLLLKISGNKSFAYKVSFKKDLNIDFTDHYYQIFQWVYSEKTKIEDKLGLTRNILTSYLNEDKIEISDSVFNSILSAYKIYVKGNISKYFEARNKIVEQVENTVKKVNNSLETFSSNFQKSTLIIISFFLSIFLSKVVKQQDISRIFNKETSYVAFAFVFLSVVYLLFSRWILKLDKTRIKERYESVKERYSDILITEDINNILENDAEYKSEIKHFNDRICIYTILWVITITVFLIIIFLTSESLTIPYIENNPT